MMTVRLIPPPAYSAPYSSCLKYTKLSAQIAAETDCEYRIALANRADKIIWENVHTLPLYQRPELIAVRRDPANYGAFGLGSV